MSRVVLPGAGSPDFPGPYEVQLQRWDTYADIGDKIVMPDLPFPGLELLHDDGAWTVRRVRVAVPQKNSAINRNGGRIHVHVLVRESEDFYVE